ncbi:unnamed protein product [Bursaphelenchus xylophilus]|uniref:(pine wood nematode) hypothetical protein n=1 Tax=Bursaphelenchus xylophilus TaxID=6326 RepID=A0A1I7RJ61_BURXY|nr:unnamed protein product [Bursaphelenchus xylophilus]CAG9119385.1 unnamed protein product [Bursaphelenchus xylophilus]
MRWKLNTFGLFLASLFVTKLADGQENCVFPEQSATNFFFDISADTPANSILVDTVVEPADADLKILSVKSNNIKTDLSSKLELDHRRNGQFLIVAKEGMSLPPYPSSINQTMLYLTVECNGKPYPLITIRIKNFNTFSPEFLNSPYEIFVANDALIGTEIETPIVAFDKDPSESYTVTYKVDSHYPELDLYASEERIELKTLPSQYALKRYAKKQIPNKMKLKVLGALQRQVYYFNVTASDNQSPEKTANTLFKVVVGDPREAVPHFTQQIYYGNFTRSQYSESEIILTQPIIALFPDRGMNLPSYEPKYELQRSDWSTYFRLDKDSARLFLNIPRHIQIPDTIELGVRAYLEADPSVSVTSKVILTDASEVKLTYFSQCRYNVHLEENPPVNSRVAQFLVKGDIDGIDLLNGTETFEVSSDGVMTVKDNRLLDREETDRVIVMARLRSSTPLHPKSLELCQLATVDITIEDANDHSPKFEQNTYTFYIEENPYNNTEVGSITATDEDKGPFGKVKYRFLDDTLPFILFQSDGVATIYYVTKNGAFSPEKSYSFTVEAYDADVYPRTSRVTVHVYLGEKTAEQVEPLDIAKTAESRDPSPHKLDKTTSQFKSFGAATLDERRSTANKLEFGAEVYNFNLTGKLDIGEYIGTIRLAEEKEDVDYELEDGIRGFVNLDSRYGTLRVGQKLLEDEYEQIRFAAMAKSRRGETLATTLVTIYIDEKAPEYSLNPLFEQAIYRFEIEENQPEQSLAQIEAHHRSVELGKDKIWYTLDRTNEAKLFKIDPETGWLASKKPLDFEEKKTYDLRINGCLESNTKKCGHADAIVVVKDLNDNEPVFEKTHYQVEIPSDLSVGSEVVQVQATDKDSGLNAKLRYFISSESGIYAHMFTVDEETGQVRLAKPLGPEVTEMSFYVTAKDSAEPPMMGRAQVQITVLNTGFSNVNAPEFDDFRYEVSFRAPIPAGATIGRVKASDKDPGLDGKVWYSLVEDHLSRKFTINRETGEIKTTAPISVADGDLIQLTVEAHDSAPKFPRKTPSIFMIHLVESEEPLAFLPMPKTVYISSSKPVGSNIFKVGLKNGDSKNVKFMVDQDPRNQLFGMIDDYLIVLLRLKQGVYKISIRAFNPKNNQSTVHSLKMVVMTDRDKYPVFERLGYELKVPADSSFPVKLPAFPVSLRSGRIQYTLYSANGVDLPKGVKIDEITGELTVFEEFTTYMERELARNEAFLVVRAINEQDPEFYSDVGVTLSLKRPVNELIFTSKLYRLIVREGASVGSIINSVKIGVQQPNLHPKLSFSMSPNEWFDITEKGEVLLKKQVDLEGLPKEWNGVVELTVTAQDGSKKAETQVQIKVEDENEYAPKFEQAKYSFTVDSAVRPGTQIGQVVAYDKDFSDQGKVIYKAKIGSAVGLVDVRSDGKIFKSDSEPFEPGSHYNLIITASDSKGKQTETIILFDVTEDSSVISPMSEKSHIMHKSEAWSPESVDDGMMIDAMPKGNWDFKILEGNENNGYMIKKMNKTTAKLAIMNQNMLKKTRDHLLIEATNLDDPFEKVETDLTVDLKALKPAQKLEFEPNQLDEVLVNAATAQPNSPIFRAKVKGGGDVKFSIPGGPESLFKIDSEYGDVYLNHPIDQLENGEHELLVTVSSGRQKASKVFTVIVSVPTASPEPFQFSTVGKIDENLVESMEQEDSEGHSVKNEEITKKIEYTTTESTTRATTTQRMVTTTERTTRRPETTISSTTKPSPTTVKPTTTQATTKIAAAPETTLTTFSVVSISPSLASSASSSTLSFGKPKYKFEILNPKPNDVVGKLDIASKGPVKMNIVPEQFKQWFGVDPSSHTLYMRDVPQELEGRQRAEFTVIAQDARNSRVRAEVPVKVDLVLGKADELVHPEDEVEEEPTSPTVDFSIDTEATTLTTVVEVQRVTVTPVVVHVTSQPIVTSSEPETTDGATTEIFENTPDFESVTVATEETRHREESTAISSNVGVLRQHKFTAILPEGRYGNRGAVVNLRPSSLKDNIADTVADAVFEIDSDEPSLPFYVRNETGDLIAFANIDREQKSLYKFNVLVKSLSSPEVKDTAEVTITILDVNDNYPVFENAPYVIGVNINELPTKTIAVFKATDEDEGPAGKVKYRITKNYNGLFDINSKGELSLTTKITALPPDDTEIEVTALDGGRPALKTPQTVRIEVFEESDAPAFKKPEYNVNLGKDAKAGEYVYQVIAGLSPYTYEIKDGGSDLFSIDQSNGLIRLAKDPQPDDQNRYHILNVSAISDQGKTAHTTLNVFLEGEPIVVTVPPPAENQKCRFAQKIYNAEIRENLPGKNKLVTVSSDCQKQGRDVAFSIHQANDVFSVDPKTGEVFVNGALDREQKGMHFIVLNVTEITRPSRQTNNPVVDYAKKKLSEDQALVSVKVLDENDNEPVFANKNSQGELVAIIDWQAPLLQPVVRLVATDADEKNRLSYSIEQNEYFSVNSTNGLVYLTKSLLNSYEDRFKMRVTVHDGAHEVSASLTVYKLAPGTNIVFLGVEKPEGEVDEQVVAKKLSVLTGKDAIVLVKQIFINEEGQAILNKTHLFVYALDKATKTPIDAALLKSLLDKSKDKLEDTDLKVMSIQLPVVASRLIFSWTEAIILAVFVIAILAACLALIWCLRCMKHRSIHVTKTDMDYMVTAESPGPQPLNVGLISSRKAQDVLARHPLPEAIEENTMTPEARSAMIASAGVVYDNRNTTPSSTVTDVPPDSSHSPSSSVL